jgi:hypothetical protein
MAYKFPDGAHFYFSSTFAAAKTISAFTNANPGVATSVGHGFADDEELLLISPWEDATDTVFRADQLSADTLSLKGLDTSSVNFFGAGGGVGSTLQKISAWQEIPQVLTIATSGGDARTATIAPLSRRRPINVALGTNPVSITLTIGHDASNAVFQQMLAVTKALTKVAFKMVLSDGSATYGYGNLVTGSLPGMQAGRENQANVALTFLGQDIAYA